MNGLGFVLIVFGVPNVVWPYEIARFEERIDSIGSERSWSTVEPADWKVTLTRVFGVGLIVAGVAPLLAG